MVSPTLPLVRLRAGSYHPRMKSPRLVIALVILLGTSGCSSYDPPVQGDHTSARYKSDLQQCRATSAETIRLKNADTPSSWILSPFTGPPKVRAAIRTCMAGKGYPLDETGT